MPESRKFVIETLYLPQNEISQQLLYQINYYEILMGHKSHHFRKNKLLEQIEYGLSLCFDEQSKHTQYGVIYQLSIQRITGSWFNLWSTESFDDYLLFRGYEDHLVYLIANDPTFTHHASKGYVKQSKIFITLAIIDSRNDVTLKGIRLYHFYDNYYSINHKKDKIEFPSWKYFNFSKKDNQKTSFWKKNLNSATVQAALPIDKHHLNLSPPSLPLFPFNLGNKQFSYKNFPQRWFIQKANNDNTICWLKRSAMLSRNKGPLDGIPSINRPVAISTLNPFMVIYPCRFGDLVNLLYSQESYTLRYWLKKNPFEFLELLRLILEPIALLHTHLTDLSNYTIAKGNKIYRNISWPIWPENTPSKTNHYTPLVHTDIKLDNFLFQPEMIYNIGVETNLFRFKFNVEITDFDGLAYEGQQMQGNATPGYISPQMEESYLKSKHYYVSQLDDSYSTGEMLYRISKVLIPQDHPLYKFIYEDFLEPLINKLKNHDPFQRMGVIEAHSNVCKYITNLKNTLSILPYNLETTKDMKLEFSTQPFASLKPTVNQDETCNTKYRHCDSNKSLCLDKLPKKPLVKHELSRQNNNCLLHTREVTQSTECVSSLYRKSQVIICSQGEISNMTYKFESDHSGIHSF